MEDLCSACLCKDRKLRYLSQTNFYNIYTQIINEIPIYDLSQVSIKLCWECISILTKYSSFKENAKDSYLKLLDCAQQFHKTTIPWDISKTSHLLQTAINIDSFVPGTDVKVESDQNSEAETYHDQSEETFNRHFVFSEEMAVKMEDSNLEPKETVTETYSKSETKERFKKKKRLRKKYVKLPKFVEIVTLSLEEVEVERKLLRCSDEYTMSEYKCERCYSSYAKEDDLKLHLLEFHSELRFTCDICAFTSSCKSELNRHIRGHTRRYRCVKCGYMSVNRDAILKHNQSHKVCRLKYNKTLRETSPSAPAVPVSRPPRVVVECYSESGQPKCVECDKVFSTKKTYTYHINSLHRGQNKFPCPECGKIYQWKSNLWRHIKNHKARDSGELHCDPCNKSFSSVATYRQHLKISRQHVSENDYNYTCDECGRKFVSKLKLKDHVDWEHLNRVKYKCQICNKPFKSGTSLYIHIQNVHRNKDERDNLCHVCGKSYQNEAKLKYHIVAMHSGETPYRCGHCSATFSWYSSLYRHVKEVHQKLKVNRKLRKKKDATAEDLNEEHPEGGHLVKRNFKLPSLDQNQGNMLQTLLGPGPS